MAKTGKAPRPIPTEFRLKADDDNQAKSPEQLIAEINEVSTKIIDATRPWRLDRCILLGSLKGKLSGRNQPKVAFKDAILNECIKLNYTDACREAKVGRQPDPEAAFEDLLRKEAQKKRNKNKKKRESKIGGGPPIKALKDFKWESDEQKHDALMELTDALATDGIALIAWQYQDDGADEDELRDWVELYLSHHKRGVT